MFSPGQAPGLPLSMSTIICIITSRSVLVLLMPSLYWRMLATVSIRVANAGGLPCCLFVLHFSRNDVLLWVSVLLMCMLVLNFKNE